MWVAITGGIGTGKSTVSNSLKKRGYTVLDADEIARLVVGRGQPALAQIAKEFGANLITKDGELDRQKLAQIVFTDTAKRIRLEEITHPEIRQTCLRLRDERFAAGDKIVFYDVPLLFEKNLQSEFHFVAVVASSEKNQMQRLKQRTNWSESEIRGRMQAQMPVVEKQKRAHFVIHNDGSLADLEIQVDQLLKAIETYQAQE